MCVLGGEYHMPVKRYASTEKGKTMRIANFQTEGKGLPLSAMTALLCALDGSVHDVAEWNAMPCTAAEKKSLFKQTCPTLCQLDKKLSACQEEYIIRRKIGRETQTVILYPLSVKGFEDARKNLGVLLKRAKSEGLVTEICLP